MNNCEKLRLRHFQGSQVSSFDFSTLYTSLLHDLFKSNVLFLFQRCQTHTSVLQLRRDFSNKKYESYKSWTYTELLFLWKIYMCKYQQIVILVNPMGTNCAQLTADLFRYCYEREFMSM